MILMAVPFDFCQALMAGLGPTYAASSWPASSAVVSSVPELKTEIFRLTPLPRSLAKKPLFRPTSAGSWVMLASRPSRSVTLPEPDPDEAEDEAQPATTRAAAATPAVSGVRLIDDHLSDQFSRHGDRRFFRST